MKSKRGKTVAKGDLPQKDCATCGRPFTWRKKWAAVWDEVRYCSDACRRARKSVDAKSPS
ncbi:MAG: DUF2256 domain-containing protein [Pseudomonadota bacterium]